LLYGRTNIVHKSWPRRNEKGELFYKAECGAKIPKNNPYSKCATQWRFVTCKECLQWRRER